LIVICPDGGEGCFQQALAISTGIDVERREKGWNAAPQIFMSNRRAEQSFYAASDYKQEQN
ncbi:MAG: hypothetical protein ACM3XO_07265, partial [Bacteroidota bacterium]